MNPTYKIALERQYNLLLFILWFDITSFQIILICQKYLLRTEICYSPYSITTRFKWDFIVYSIIYVFYLYTSLQNNIVKCYPGASFTIMCMEMVNKYFFQFWQIFELRAFYVQFELICFKLQERALTPVNKTIAYN